MRSRVELYDGSFSKNSRPIDPEHSIEPLLAAASVHFRTEIQIHHADHAHDEKAASQKQQPDLEAVQMRILKFKIIITIQVGRRASERAGNPQRKRSFLRFPKMLQKNICREDGEF